MKKNTVKHNITAAVDIGSYGIKMKLAEAASDGSIITLETPKRFVNIGKDIFTTGEIKHDVLEEICGILNNFKKLMSEYMADKVMIVATTAFREADNRDYILDYIYRKTGLKIDVISESVEKFYIYGSIVDSLENFHELKQEGVLIADVGSGGVEITLFHNGDLVFSQYIKMGALRLKEVLSKLERRTLNFPNLIGEYIESEIDTLKIMLLQNKIQNFVVIGSEIHVVHDILRKSARNYDHTHMAKEAFYKVYHQVIGKSQKQLVDTYQLNSEKFETLVPALLMYEKFLSFTHSDIIYTPDVSLCDGITRYLADKKFQLENNAFSDRDIVASIKKLGERYSYDSRHAEQVEKISLLLFDGSRRLHGYSDRQRLYLQLAAISHDIGKYINIKDHNVLSHNIILNSDILGLSKAELLIIANIVKYHALSVPSMEDPDYGSLDFNSRIMVSKLSAFIKIADSLDRSHKQKLSGIKVLTGDQNFSIKAETQCDCLLEEWEFENKSNLFKEIYGIKPTLIIKRK
ncbi:MAG TPA: HD domain-containing protein [Clostridia bacterium]|nr:HD domain-containing protein [Clostridia bacterium]